MTPSNDYDELDRTRKRFIDELSTALEKIKDWSKYSEYAQFLRKKAEKLFGENTPPIPKPRLSLQKEKPIPAPRETIYVKMRDGSEMATRDLKDGELAVRKLKDGREIKVDYKVWQHKPKGTDKIFASKKPGKTQHNYDCEYQNQADWPQFVKFLQEHKQRRQEEQKVYEGEADPDHDPNHTSEEAESTKRPSFSTRPTLYAQVEKNSQNNLIPDNSTKKQDSIALTNECTAKPPADTQPDKDELQKLLDGIVGKYDSCITVDSTTRQSFQERIKSQRDSEKDSKGPTIYC